MFSIMPAPIFPDFSGYHHQHHTPTVSSPLSSSPTRASSPPAPLSPRDANALPSRRQVQSSPIPASKFRYAARPARPNPVLRSREGTQQSRRDMFLRGVQQRADDRRWERRGVESKLLSAEWFNVDQARRQAKVFDRDGVITEADIADAERLLEEQSTAPMDQPYHDLDDMMVDALMQEEAELEALISSSAQQFSSSESTRPHSPHWSDEEDYDTLFMDFLPGDDSQLPVSSGDAEMT